LGGTLTRPGENAPSRPHFPFRADAGPNLSAAVVIPSSNSWGRRLWFGLKAFSVPILFIRDENTHCARCGCERSASREWAADCGCGHPILGSFTGLASSVWNACRPFVFRGMNSSPRTSVEHRLDGSPVGAFYQLFSDQEGVALDEIKLGTNGGQVAKWKQGFAFWKMGKLGEMFDFKTLATGAAQHEGRIPFGSFKVLDGGDLAVVYHISVYHTRWGDTSASMYERLTVLFCYAVLNRGGVINFHRDATFNTAYTANAKLRTCVDIRESLWHWKRMGGLVQADLFAASQAERLNEIAELGAASAALAEAARVSREEAQAAEVARKREEMAAAQAKARADNMAARAKTAAASAKKRK